MTESAKAVFTENDATLLRRAIQIGHDARKCGRHPFGALVTDAIGRIITERGNNSRPPDGDPTQHAELAAVAAAYRALGPDGMQGSVLYTSAEPCAMCTAAAYWTGIDRIVYALSEEHLLILTGNNAENPTLSLPCRQVIARGQRPIVVVGPVLEDEASVAHIGFWDN
jgi:tRNA(Arg) A34 adenosine deaminase TadA